MGTNYGVVQPLIDTIRKPYDMARRALGYIPDNLPGLGGGKVDTSYSDDMARNAMRSFQQRDAQQRAAAAAATARTPAKRTPKRTPARPAAKRR